MPAYGSTAIVALACLLGMAAGCRGVPGVADQAKDNPSNQSGDDEGGWLFDRLTGRKSPPAEKTPEPDSGVRQASAEMPVHPPQGSAGQRPEDVPENVDKALREEERAKQGEQHKDHGFALSDLKPKNLYNKAVVLAGYSRDENIARQLFEEGQELYRDKKYPDAAEKFKWAAIRWPNSPLEEDALFYRGESLFFADRYADASDVFGELMKKYQNSRYLDRAVRREFAIGRYWEQAHEALPLWPVVPNLTDRKLPRFDTWGNALKAYESIQMNDPTGPLADDAVMATANAYFVKGRYEEAAYQYDLLRKQYPKSEHQLDAHRLGMKAKLLMYQGPMYDGSALDQAGEIADQTLAQFRGQLTPDERDRVVEEKNGIVQQQAERQWRVGQYYDRKGYYGSARFYYQGILDNTRFAGTDIAKMAAKRLEEIKDKPDVPPNRFKWLTNLFPRFPDGF